MTVNKLFNDILTYIDICYFITNKLMQTMEGHSHGRV